MKGIWLLRSEKTKTHLHDKHGQCQLYYIA